MSNHTVPNSTVVYHLVRYDEHGAETAESDGSLASKKVLDEVEDGVTDVFLLSHGWKGDVPAAIRQYDRWVGAMTRQQADRDRIRALVPEFKALIVGLHWPSLPWGDEKPPVMLLGGEVPAEPEDPTQTDEFADEAEMDIGRLVDLYTERLTAEGADEAAVAAVRTALTTIITAADDPAVAAQVNQGGLPADLVNAYTTLFERTDAATEGAVAAPGADQDDFDPQRTLKQWVGEAGAPAPAGDLLLGPIDGLAELAKKAKDALLMPVRQLSFWTMKRRAKVVGERGIHDLVVAIQTAAPNARIHLMGHSFGCIVVSAAVAGPVSSNGNLVSRLNDPVDSVFLVQGAMSLWSYADDVPFDPGSRGYFRVMRTGPTLVTGPIVTTRSTFDTAVGKLYPLGAKIVDDVLLGEELPKFGGIGTWGIQGAAGHDTPVLAATEDYGFIRGEIYNVEASRVITNGGGPSGAHSDISHDEVAHVMWQAVTASVVGGNPPPR
jgi:hypothetical protein